MTNDDRIHRNLQRLPQAVVIGDFKVLSRPGQAFERTKVRLIQQDLKVQETPHFFFARMPNTQKVILVHQLSHDERDNNIRQYLMQELAPYGLMTSERAFGAALIGEASELRPKPGVEATSYDILIVIQNIFPRSAL